MVTSASPIVPSVLSHIYYSVLHEADVFSRSTWRDWLSTPISGTIFILGSLTYLPFEEAISNSAIILLNLTIYIYFFNTWTQYTSVEEDRINKPDRPILAGITTPAGAKRRGLVLTALWFSFAIYRPDLIVETWILVIATITLGMNNLGRRWFVKNTICMSIMTWGFLSSPRKLMGAPLPNTSGHLIALAVWVGFVSYAQDFRDVEGDKESGSWTLPMVLGDDNARLLFAFVCMPLGYMTLWYNGMAQLAPWILAGLHVLVSYRFMTLRNRKADHASYMWICKIFCIMCGLSSLEAAKLISPDRPLEAAMSCLFSGWEVSTGAGKLSLDWIRREIYSRIRAYDSKYDTTSDAPYVENWAKLLRPRTYNIVFSIQRPLVG